MDIKNSDELQTVYRSIHLYLLNEIGKTCITFIVRNRRQIYIEKFPFRF
jgi:hypothetical protein